MPRLTPLLTGLLAVMRPGRPAACAEAACDVAADAPPGATGAPERRASERMPLRRGAMLELPGRRRTAVNLLDLSEGGAALEAEGLDVAPGMAGALMLDTALLPVSVVAVSGARVHLAFQALSPEAEAVLARLLRSVLEPSLAA